jgi:hypothetical protein
LNRHRLATTLALATILPVASLVALPGVARADDAAACSDAYAVAQSRPNDRKMAFVRAQLRTCARPECGSLLQGQMVKDCTAWLAAAEAGMPTVILAARDPAGNDVTEVTVTVDGVVVATKLDGIAIAVEPGSHTFKFTSATGATGMQNEVILDGTKNNLLRVVLSPPEQPATPPAAVVVPPPPPSPPPPPGAGATAPTSPAAPPPAGQAAPAPAARPAEVVPLKASDSGGPSYWTGQRILGASLAAGGVVGIGIGGIVGLTAKSQFNTAEGESGQQRVNDSSSAASQGNVASVVVGVGAAVAVGGIVVWLLAPSDSTQVGVNGRELFLRGTF